MRRIVCADTRRLVKTSTKLRSLAILSSPSRRSHLTFASDFYDSDIHIHSPRLTTNDKGIYNSGIQTTNKVAKKVGSLEYQKQGSKPPTTQPDDAIARIFEITEVDLHELTRKLIETYSDRRYDTFLEDLHVALQCPNHKIHECLPTYLKWRRFLSYVLKDLCELIILDRYTFLRSSLGLLEKLHVLSRTKAMRLVTIKDKDDFISELAKCMIEKAIFSNCSFLATVFVMQLTKVGYEIDNEIMGLLFIGLTSGLPEDYLENAYATLQLINFLGFENIAPMQVDRIMRYLCTRPHGMYFANYLFRELVAENFLREYAKEHPIEFAKMINSLIQTNINNYNLDFAFKVWTHAAPYVADKAKFIPVLVQLFTDAPVQYTEDIKAMLFELPHDVISSDEMTDFQISFYGSDNSSQKQFDFLARSLKPPLRRTTMSLLLQAFVAMDKETNAQKTIEAIFKHGGGILPEDIKCIVERLLIQGKLIESINMVEKMDFHISKFAWVSVFRYMLIHDCVKSTPRNKQFMDKLFNKLIALEDANVNELVTIAIIEGALVKLSLRGAVGTYNSISKAVLNYRTYNKGESFIVNRLPQIGVPETFENVLRLTPKGLGKCVEYIAIAALEQKNGVILEWVMGELKSLGWDYSSILNLLRRHDKHGFLNEVLKEQVLEDCR